MPLPPSPPPADEPAAQLQPRQLNRWLDLNPIVKLTRTETFFQLPAFDIDSDWKGYSEIVGVFNYSASNNFALKTFTPPTDPNYVACIAWVDEDRNMFRYKLWEGVGEVLYFNPPLYTGQLIKKNFRIEIWNCAPSVVDSMVLVGAGTANVNGNYSYSSSVSWPQNPGVNACAYNAGTGFWEVTLGTVKYKVSGTTFPFGVYIVVFGASPAPYAILATTSSNDETLSFYTTLRGGYDYIWADDSAVGSPSALVTDFDWPINGATFDLPFVWPVDSVPTVNE